MAELNLISVSEGPDLEMEQPIEDSHFENLLADEVVVDWLRSLEAENQPRLVVE